MVLSGADRGDEQFSLKFFLCSHALEVTSDENLAAAIPCPGPAIFGGNALWRVERARAGKVGS